MLLPGQRFTHAGKAWHVLSVNDSRAHCKCEAAQQVTVDGRTFTATSGQSIDISPNSVVEMLEGLVTIAPPRQRAPKPDKMEARVVALAKPTGTGWYRTGTPATLRAGSRLAEVADYIITHPGAHAEDVVRVLGKSAGQIVQDLKRKGLVEKR